MSISVFAKTVSCVNPKVRNSPVVLQYDFQDSASARFGGNLLIMGQAVPDFQIAQYKNSSSGLFLVLDDADTATTPMFVFSTGKPSMNYAFSGEAKSTMPGVLPRQPLSCRIR